MNIYRPVIGLSLLIAVLYGVTVWWDPNLPLRRSGPLIMLNVLPALLAVGILLGLSRRLAWSGLLMVAFLAWVFFVNAVKLETLNQPAVFGDFLLIYQTVRGFDLLGKYGSPVLLLLVIGLVIAAAIWLFRVEKPAFGLRSGFVLALVSLLALLSLGQRDWPLGSFYQDAPLKPRDWDPVENAEVNGVVASLARAASRIRFDFDQPLPPAGAPPEAIDREAVAPLRTPAGTPDVIVVLSESFFDTAILAGVGDCELLPSWCALRDQGISGTLQVPTYAGNTTRTEFELLTAVPIATFKGLDYVYLSVVTQPVRSLVWMLHDQGYETFALHNHHTYFWNRSSAFPRLGFDEFLGLEDLGKRVEVGYYASDAMLDAPMADLLDLDRDDPPRLLFVVTMENHGPWNERRRTRLPETVNDYAIPAAAAAIPGAPLQQYLYHADRSMAQLQALWQQVQERERETVLVLFGDHLPGLPKTYDALGFDDGQLPATQFTPYLVLANYELPGSLPEHLPMHQLLPQLLHAAGLALTPDYAELVGSWRAEQATAAEGTSLEAYRERLYLELLRAPVTQPPPNP